ncbi:helix-turn-helix domain-containing protein, partial [Kocuria subflava]
MALPPTQAVPARTSPSPRLDSGEAAESWDGVVLGRRLRHLRTQRSLTLDALADRVGATASHLSLVENGRREPKLSLLSDLASALGVSMDALL